MAAFKKEKTIEILGGEVRALQLHWRAAVKANESLPRYEDVVLGSLGRLADRLMLIGEPHTADARILQAGRDIERWLGENIGGSLLRDMPPDCLLPASEAIAEALRTRAPVSTVAYRVRDGVVESYELLAMPLACRWGPPLVAIYVHECGVRYDLVDAIFQATGDGILAMVAIRNAAGVTQDLQIVAFNEAAARLLRADTQDLLWRRVSELRVGENAAEAFARFLNASRSGTPDQFELTMQDDTGVTHLRVGVCVVNDLLSVTLTDVNELKLREASMKLLFDGNPMPMWLYDPETLQFLSVNDAALSHYNYSRAQFEAMTLPEIWPRDELDLHRDIALAVNDTYESERSWRHIKSDGTEIEVLTYARRLTFGGRPAVLVAVVDVTERRQAEARIAYMAHHDALTALPNRVQFQQRLEEVLERVAVTGGNAAVLYLDLDRFKFINDSLGHPIGDQLLNAVAKRLRDCVRPADMVARLGGDEFAIIMSDVAGPEAVGTLAAKLVQTLSRRYEIQGNEVVGGASIGIVMAPHDGHTHESLLRNADMALYRAKADGRGRYHFFEPEMERRAQLRRTLELDLRKAFENGHMDIFYQPFVNLNTSEISGFEALLRWRHPERGMVSPSEFIPLAEEIGLIVPLGEWVLRRACAEAAHWPNDIKVAIKLSPVQFRTKGLVQAVISALAHAGLAPSRLELEITESVLLAETSANISTLHQLRGLGVRISLDDFGTGYSSLSYLRSFPFDKIKIDQSFVRELAERPDSCAIVRAVIGLGASLGIATTAEGVENEDQLERLRREGCTEVQGFLFSPARPSSEIAELLRQNRGEAAKVA
ncbi:MAG: EAL domain-containing protein [Xanthobacteraceae bacterium]